MGQNKIDSIRFERISMERTVRGYFNLILDPQVCENVFRPYNPSTKTPTVRYVTLRAKYGTTNRELRRWDLPS